MNTSISPPVFKIVGAILLVVGIILFVLGIQASDSLASEISEFVEGTPSDKSVWLLVGGSVLTVAGLMSIVLPARPR